MTNDEINIAVAEHCGWKFIAFDMGWKDAGDGKVKAKIPDYCKDLNAMREAELTLWRDPCDVETYEENLHKEVLNAVGYQGADIWFMASAGIRAIAFLKTIDKWKE